MRELLHQTRALESVQERLKQIESLTEFVADQVVLTRNDVKDIKGFCQMLTSQEQEARSKKLERQDMPSKPAIFYGRDDLVRKTSKLLSLSTTGLHICLLGPGGMGKTSLALAIIESPLVQAKFQEERRVWVPCVEATSGSLFLQVLYTSLRVQRQTGGVMRDILDELKSSKEPYLLLLDNFETPWNTTNESDQKRVEEILHKLNQLSHVSILITMRGSHSPTIDVEWHSETVPATDKNACRCICQRINPRWNLDPDIDDLVDAVGCMPFAVTLMASRGRESGCSAKELLDEWTQLGTDMWSPDGSLESGMNKSISLSVDSDCVKRDPDALYLLATLSMLPAGTSRKNLVYWAPKLKSLSGAITTLSRAALLQTASQDDAHASQTLFVLPVIQSFMLHRSRIPEHIQQSLRSAFCEYVLDHACRYRDPTFKANAAVLAKEDVNIQSILVAATDHSGSGFDDQLVRALLAFSWYQRDTKPMIAVAGHTLKVAKVNGNQQYIAEALLCLGSSYAEVDNYTEAKGLLEESSQLLIGDESSQQLGFECALASERIGWLLHSSYKERETIIKSVIIKTEDSDKYWHACAFDALGWLYWYHGEYHQALAAFVPAADMLLLQGCSRDAASALLGKAHALNQLYVPDEQVLDAVQEAWEVVKHLDPSSIYSNILSLSGRVLLRMGRLVDASSSFETCLRTRQYVGEMLGVAVTFSDFGYMYLHTGAYSDAYLAFEAAAEKYADLGDKSPDRQTHEPRCRENMERIKLKQENPDRRIGFYRPRGARAEDDLFYPPEVTSHP